MKLVRLQGAYSCTVAIGELLVQFYVSDSPLLDVKLRGLLGKSIETFTDCVRLY